MPTCLARVPPVEASSWKEVSSGKKRPLSARVVSAGGRIPPRVFRETEARPVSGRANKGALKRGTQGESHLKR